MAEETNAKLTEDQILDQILDRAGVSKETSVYGQQQTTPQPKVEAPKAEATPEPVETASEAPVAPKEEPASKEDTTRPQDTSPELKAAYKALRRDGVPYNLLDKMSTDNPDELIEWAAKARKRQEDVDAKLGATNQDSSESNEATGEADSDSSQESSTESTDDTISKLKEQFGDEMSEPLLKLNTQLQQQNERLQQQLQAMQETQLQESLALSERVLSNLWPDLSTNRDQIQQRMAQIGTENPNQFNSVEQMMFAAAVDILGEPKQQPAPVQEAKAEAPKEQTNQSAAEPDPRDLGQPAKQSGGNMPTAAMSNAELEDLALEAILNGQGLEGAKRAMMQS
jgi:hypothetical protein